MPSEVGRYDLNVIQGATFRRVFTWKDSAGALVNLTGYTADAQVRSSVSSSTILVECSTTNGKIVLGGAAGTITLTISPADTTGATWPKDSVWDLELTSGSSVTRLLAGKAILNREVTR